MQTPQRGRRGPSAAVSSSRPTSNFPDIPGLCPFPRGSNTAHPHAPSPCRGSQPPEWERSQKHPRPDLAAAGPGEQGHLALKSSNPAKCRQRGDAGSYLWALLSVCRSDPYAAGSTILPSPFSCLAGKQMEAEEREYDDNEAYYYYC